MYECPVLMYLLAGRSIKLQSTTMCFLKIVVSVVMHKKISYFHFEYRHNTAFYYRVITGHLGYYTVSATWWYTWWYSCLYPSWVKFCQKQYKINKKQVKRENKLATNYQICDICIIFREETQKGVFLVVEAQREGGGLNPLNQ